MIKWRLFGKSKEEISETQSKTVGEAPVNNIEVNKPICEYHETLQTGKPTTKKYTVKDSNVKQHIWRDMDAIERKIDDIHIKHAKKPKTEIDKTVDKLIENRKKK